MFWCANDWYLPNDCYYFSTVPMDCLRHCCSAICTSTKTAFGPQSRETKTGVKVCNRQKQAVKKAEGWLVLRREWLRIQGRGYAEDTGTGWAARHTDEVLTQGECMQVSKEQE